MSDNRIVQRTVIAVIALWTLPACIRPTHGQAAAQTGIELVGRSSADAPPAEWSIYDATTKKLVARQSGQWGALPVLAGSYYVTILPRGSDVFELRWADVVVQAGQVARVAVDSGIDLSPANKDDPPPDEWYLSDATGKKVTRIYRHWGFMPAPPGEYQLSFLPQGSDTWEIVWGKVRVEPGKVTAAVIDSGVSLSGPSKDDPPPDEWYLSDATGKKVTRIYRHWGFMPAPPGEYQLSFLPQGSDTWEIVWGKVRVEPGKVTAAVIDSGVSLSGPSKDDPPPDEWYLSDATGKKVTRIYRHWGFMPAPPGEYQLSFLPQGSDTWEIVWGKVRVEPGKVTAAVIDSGVSLSGPSKDDPPPDEWYLSDATGKKVTRIYRHWGFMPAPPGEYQLSFLPQGSDTWEIVWGKVRVEPGKVTAAVIDSGVSYPARPRMIPRPMNGI